MKIKYTLILLILISCAQNTKKIKESLIKAQHTVKQLEDFPIKDNDVSFEKVANQITTKSLPLVDNTNFDSFIDEDDYKKVNVQALKLEKIYPNFNKEVYNYKAIACYRVEMSKVFYTLVVTILKGDHEMESVLINYDLNGKIIDSKVVSYDEIAESIFKIESRIEQEKLTINNIADMEERSEEITVFKINAEGKIKPTNVTQTSAVVDGINPVEEVILQLNLNKLKIKNDLVVSKVQPHNPNQTIVVIPEVAYEEEGYFTLNSYIVFVNNTTGEITHKFFESSKTNNWFSDAVELKEIKIDTAPYIFNENTRAFGVRLYSFNKSQPNPYSNEKISLFVKSGDKLIKVLSNYNVMEYGGEWDTDCVGEFTNVKNTLIMSKQITNNYFDIKVKSKITKTKNFVDKNGKCDNNKNTSVKTKWLRFDGQEYVKDLQ